MSGRSEEACSNAVLVSVNKQYIFDILIYQENFDIVLYRIPRREIAYESASNPIFASYLKRKAPALYLDPLSGKIEGRGGGRDEDLA